MSSSTQARLALCAALGCLLLLPGCYGFAHHGRGYHHHRGGNGLAAFAAAADLAATIFWAVEAAQEAAPPPAPEYVPPAPAPVPADEPAIAPRAPEPVAPSPSLPDAAEIRKAMGALQPELRDCTTSTHPGWVKVTLRVEASGRLRAASFGTALDTTVRRCLEDRIARARLSPVVGGPVSVDYLFDLR